LFNLAADSITNMQLSAGADPELSARGPTYQPTMSDHLAQYATVNEVSVGIVLKKLIPFFLA